MVLVVIVALVLGSVSVAGLLSGPALAAFVASAVVLLVAVGLVLWRGLG
jgi:hypothetical protein